MGSGPYKLESPDGWTPGKPIELLRNERYWGVPGTFDRIVFREIENESTEMVMFGNQELDQVHLAPDTFKRMMEDKRLTAVRTGIVCEPDRIDWPVLVNRLNNSDFDAICLGWSSTPESDPYQEFHSSQIKDQGDNRVAYSSPECDAAIEKARTTVDKAERMKG